MGIFLHETFLIWTIIIEIMITYTFLIHAYGDFGDIYILLLDISSSSISQ